VQFQYDALGLRIQKEVTQRSVRTCEITSHYKHDYLWMVDVILEDRCADLLENSHPAKQAASDNKVVSIDSNHNADSGELTSNAGVIPYLHEPSAFRPLAQIRSEQTGEGEQTESIYYYHLDHIGTPLELTDEQGRIVWQANYTGFGQARIINSGITNLIRYSGQYEDSEIGLHYNRFRYYDPSSGQYTQQDPIGLMGGEQLSQYVADPVNWVDVLGLHGDCDGGSDRGSRGNAADGSKLNKELTLDEIVDHAFDKHVLKNGEFSGLGIRTKSQFRKHADDVMSNPSSIRYYKDGRGVYIQDSTGKVLIKNPNGSGQSTMFRPESNKAYQDYINGRFSNITSPYMSDNQVSLTGQKKS
jgi:RHS repeat-associated protein